MTNTTSPQPWYPRNPQFKSEPIKWHPEDWYWEERCALRGVPYRGFSLLIRSPHNVYTPDELSRLGFAAAAKEFRKNVQNYRT